MTTSTVTYLIIHLKYFRTTLNCKFPPKNCLFGRNYKTWPKLIMWRTIGFRWALSPFRFVFFSCFIFFYSFPYTLSLGLCSALVLFLGFQLLRLVFRWVPFLFCFIFRLIHSHFIASLGLISALKFFSWISVSLSVGFRWVFSFRLVYVFSLRFQFRFLYPLPFYCFFRSAFSWISASSVGQI